MCTARGALYSTGSTGCGSYTYYHIFYQVSKQVTSYVHLLTYLLMHLLPADGGQCLPMYLHTYLLTHYLPTYLLTYYLPTYLLLTYLPTYLLTYLPTYLLTTADSGRMPSHVLTYAPSVMPSTPLLIVNLLASLTNGNLKLANPFGAWLTKGPSPSSRNRCWDSGSDEAAL